MNLLKKGYCRFYQILMRIALPFMPYKDPKIINSIAEVYTVLKDKQKKHPLIVCGPNIYKRGMTSSLEESLKNNDIAYSVFSNVVSNPTVDNVLEGAKVFTSNNCDSIIAFGGGSPMDCAKVIGAKVANPNKEINEFKGLLKVKKPIPLLIAIPTTAGTGSETTVAAVIVDEKKHYKYGISDFKLIPSYAVLDSVVMATLPPKIIAETGLDALTHAIEAFIGQSLTKVSRSESLQAIKLIFDNLEKAYEGNDDAKKAMLLASYKAGRAFTRSYVGYVHALAHPLGGKYNLGHGLANAILLPYVLKAYGNSIAAKMKQLAIYLGVANKDTSKEDCLSAMLDRINKLEASLNIPKNVKELVNEDIADLAVLADREANPLYPVPKLFGKRELALIYQKVLKSNK